MAERPISEPATPQATAAIAQTRERPDAAEGELAIEPPSGTVNLDFMVDDAVTRSVQGLPYERERDDPIYRQLRILASILLHLGLKARKPLSMSATSRSSRGLSAVSSKSMTTTARSGAFGPDGLRQARGDRRTGSLNIRSLHPRARLLPSSRS
jgi:hypothetical protein